MMELKENQIISKTTDYVKAKLSQVDAGHNFSHIERVLKNALVINKLEKGDSFLIEMGVLLHDIADEKLFDREVAETELKDFLKNINVKPEDVDSLFEIIHAVSFGNEFDVSHVLTVEQKIVRDADRLDAIGAIGIARTFHYGGSKNREIYNKSIPPQKYTSKEAYRSSTSPTINHFYEKLLLLKDRMETKEGKRLAEERHEFMQLFLKQFYDEMGE